MIPTAEELLEAAGSVLLDFDGPVTQLMPPPRNMEAANATRAPLRTSAVPLPEDVAETTDHLTVLRFAGDLDPTILAAVETAAVAAEVDAAQTCRPTPGADGFLQWCADHHKPVVIVSNNSADAIHAYLNRFALHHLIRGIVGRPWCHPHLMKPHMSLVNAALALVPLRDPKPVLIGDSVTDIEVAHAAGMPAIGFAKTPERGCLLNEHGADALTTFSGSPTTDAAS